MHQEVFCYFRYFLCFVTFMGSVVHHPLAMERIKRCCLLCNDSIRLSTSTVRRIVYSKRNCALLKSIIPTDHFQYSLPTLKVPKLEETVAKYLESQVRFRNSL